MDVTRLVNNKLIDLRREFNARGFDLRLVGGCVRDLLLDRVPNDIDLHTDANPDEQIAIYENLGIRHIPTGLPHGTVSVILDETTYEITSLRRDVETDGRHAVTEYVDNGILDHVLLKKFEELGYDADGEYDLSELIQVFQRINQSN
jgi:tRNA nucleotidyltransferase/poly(A) polymerase